MLYSSAAEYAIRALTQLALNEIEFGQPKPSPVKELAEREGIPQHFLGKVFQTLVRAGILSSMRGPHGGFALARPASQITLYEIVQAIDGTAALDRCVTSWGAGALRKLPRQRRPSSGAARRGHADRAGARAHPR
jgi:Rrf2 family protein